MPDGIIPDADPTFAKPNAANRSVTHMRVNGSDLGPGNLQVTIAFEPQQTSRVVSNCPNYGDAMVTLESLLNDPRPELKNVLRFQVLDHEGKVRHYAHFDNSSFLQGEELAKREVAWTFGHSDLVHFSAVSRAFVWFATVICRTIYHAFWVGIYVLFLCIVIGIPLISLWVAWSWIAQLLQR